MKIKVIGEELNPLIKRREVTFEVEHAEEGGTPSRFEVKKLLAEVLGEEIEKIFITKIETKRGLKTATCAANVYYSVDHSKLVESKHIINRNTLPKTEE